VVQYQDAAGTKKNKKSEKVLPIVALCSTSTRALTLGNGFFFLEQADGTLFIAMEVIQGRMRERERKREFISNEFAQLVIICVYMSTCVSR
jgi:hypothetical protein